jgi:hypothetical protein
MNHATHRTSTGASVLKLRREVTLHRSLLLAVCIAPSAPVVSGRASSRPSNVLPLSRERRAHQRSESFDLAAPLVGCSGR